MNHEEIRAVAHTGTFIGEKNDCGTITFRGIPYAEFRGRWKRLGELPASDEVFDARKVGPGCPQVSYRDWYISARTAWMDEAKCFNLNISTTDLTGKKPVFVFIHGGANITGGIFDPEFETSHFVDIHPDIVYVVMNYRLGVLGTLLLDDLTDDPEYAWAGDLCLLDQAAALKWIHENIAAFGGDPDNVTIAGQSAGSASVTMHLAMPESAKYWNRAIMMSGTTFHNRPVSTDLARKATADYMKELGAETLEEMLAMPVEQLLTVFPIDLGITHVADQRTLPDQFNNVICEGDLRYCVSGKDLMLGCANGDMDIYAMVTDSQEKTHESFINDLSFTFSRYTEEERKLFASEYLPEEDNEDVCRFMRELSPGMIDRLLNLYKADDNPDAFYAMSNCLNDFSMMYPLLLEAKGLSKHNRVFMYMLNWAPASIYPLRAYHAMDIPFVTNTALKGPLSGEFSEPEKAEIAQMYKVLGELYGNFIRSGSPDYGTEQAVCFDSATKPLLLMQPKPETVYAPRDCAKEKLAQLYRQWKSERT